MRDVAVRHADVVGTYRVHRARVELRRSARVQGVAVSPEAIMLATIVIGCVLVAIRFFPPKDAP